MRIQISRPSPLQIRGWKWDAGDQLCRLVGGYVAPSRSKLVFLRFDLKNSPETCPFAKLFIFFCFRMFGFHGGYHILLVSQKSPHHGGGLTTINSNTICNISPGFSDIFEGICYIAAACFFFPCLCNMNPDDFRVLSLDCHNMSQQQGLLDFNLWL